MQIDDDNARVRFPPPLIFLATLLVGLALARLMGEPEIPIIRYDVLKTLGTLGLVLGAGIALSAVGLFRRSGTDVKPWTPSTVLVTDGVYRWTRNPMYLGMALIYAGVAMLLDDLTVLLLLIPVVIVIQREVIAREEAYLEVRFGEPYRAYRASVRRWI
jgi:protein-S-isoprenylcysteine O-methyltransferase Ste14